MFPGETLSSTPLLRTAGERPVPPIGIAVMGATGSGKTSFINIASGSELPVGKNLKSCTAEVAVAKDFTLDGRRVFLIDTPGFDDTTVSDAEILEKIAAFLAVTYEEGSKLAGILYIQRISDDRFTGANVRNFRMFRKLCGDPTLKNVIMVTNMWGRVEKDVGEARERELADVYLKPALDKGAQMARHQNSAQSAHEIIRRIMKNNPTPLRIQQELVDEGKNIRDTEAGEAVNEEMSALIKRHQAEMKALREEMNQALKEKDETLKRELEEETRKIRVQMDRMKVESVAMEAKYNEERKKMERTMQDMQEEARRERERTEAAHMKELNQLRAQLEENTGASAQDRQQLLQRIHQLELRSNEGGGGGSRRCIII